MTEEPSTPLDSGKKENPSSSTEVSDLQLTSPSEVETPLLKNTDDSKEPPQESPPKSNEKPNVGSNPSSDSSNDTFQTAANITVRKVKSVPPTLDAKAVYHVLKTIGFHGYWVKYLMQDHKLNTYQKLCEITQDQWDPYVIAQTGTDYLLLLDTEDFNRIVIFQNWCALNPHYTEIPCTKYIG